MLCMTNNLEKMILKSGMSKREVAAIKGVTPETLSRHMHGKVQMSLLDAEQYAKILDCSMYDVIFASRPVPIIGYVHLHDDEKIQQKIAENSPQGLGKVYIHNNAQKDVGAIIYSAEESYSGKWLWYKNAVEFVLMSPIREKLISKHAMMEGCWVKTTEKFKIGNAEPTNIMFGVLYPQPGNKHTLHMAHKQTTLTDLELEWASPVVAVSVRPDIRGLKIVYDK